MRLRVAPRLHEIGKVSLVRLKLSMGQPPAKQFIAEPYPVGVVPRLRDQFGPPRGVARRLAGFPFGIGYATAHHGVALGDDLPIPAITVRHDPKLNILM